MKGGDGSLCLVVAILCALLLAAASPEHQPPADVVAAHGYAITTGAAPGYVPDRACAGCHADLYESYQEVGMARSFFRPRRQREIEDFVDNVFFHEASRRYYEMMRSDDGYTFRRYQLDAAGREIHAFEQKIDWVLGSGHHSRTYLYRTPSGELYQLPLAWYTQTASWGMAPGFDRRDHEGVGRRVRRECMFCHNAYPDVVAGSDAYGMPQVFPVELPEGTGCQRCHGPGAEHVRSGLAGDFESLATTIVHPGRLSPERRNDVCYECHMQPSVALPGVRRFGRGDYSFRPGESLADYLAQVDVEEEGQERHERFEINHHPYRLEQSLCFVASAGALGCLTCHDPHRKVQGAERAAHYRAACLSCHEVDACALPQMSTADAQDAAVDAQDTAVDAQDCVACHMPKRRTQDVVQVVMTDHLIRRQPGEELLAPLEESEPTLVGVEFLQPERAPTGAMAAAYRAAAVVRAGGGAAAIARLEQTLSAHRPAAVDPFLDLARGQLRARRLAAAEQTLGLALERAPGHPLAERLLVMVYAGQGRRQEALAAAALAAERSPQGPEAQFNLGRLLAGYGRPREAVAPLVKATELRPNMVAAWFHLAEVYRQLERGDAAVAAYRRALAVEPAHGEACLALGRLLLERGERATALRIWRHGVDTVARPGAIRAALAAAENAGP